MFCPDDKKEVEISEVSPQVSRLRMDGSTVMATVEIIDLCSECNRQLQSTKMDVTRQLKDVPVLHPHLKHKFKAQLIKVERLHETPGYGAVKLFYGITCECENLTMYEGNAFGSAQFIPTP